MEMCRMKRFSIAAFLENLSNCLRLKKLYHKILYPECVVGKMIYESYIMVLEQEMEKEMATHSSILAWRIPWTKEPVGLQSTGSQRVGHD